LKTADTFLKTLNVPHVVYKYPDFYKTL